MFLGFRRRDWGIRKHLRSCGPVEEPIRFERRLKGRSSVSTFVCTFHVICRSINAFPSSHIRFSGHRFMPEKGPCLKRTQVCTPVHSPPPPHPTHFLSDLWKHIQTWHWARDILQGRSQPKEISAGHRMWPKPFSPSFLRSFFFTDQSNFDYPSGVRGAGEKGPDEGCGVDRAHRKEKSLVRGL